jgi:hypothetical protein
MTERTTDHGSIHEQGTISASVEAAPAVESRGGAARRVAEFGRSVVEIVAFTVNDMRGVEGKQRNLDRYGDSAKADSGRAVERTLHATVTSPRAVQERSAKAAARAQSEREWAGGWSSRLRAAGDRSMVLGNLGMQPSMIAARRPAPRSRGPRARHA